MYTIARTLQAWLVGLALLMLARVNPSDTAAADAADERDRGDVPGWVMLTVMTAIVVIALLAVFRDQVVTAVQNAFESVSGATA